MKFVPEHVYTLSHETTERRFDAAAIVYLGRLAVITGCLDGEILCLGDRASTYTGTSYSWQRSNWPLTQVASPSEFYLPRQDHKCQNPLVFGADERYVDRPIAPLRGDRTSKPTTRKMPAQSPCSAAPQTQRPCSPSPRIPQPRSPSGPSSVKRRLTFRTTVRGP